MRGACPSRCTLGGVRCGAGPSFYGGLLTQETDKMIVDNAVANVRNVLINMQRDEHPCTYSLFDPSDLRCQICGKERASESAQGFHGGNRHFDGTFETDQEPDLEYATPVMFHGKLTALADIPFIMTEVELLDDGFWLCTVTATLLSGYPQ